MRVVSGEFRRRVIKAVPGNTTRPTTDKIKESIFNIVGPYFNGGDALDLFAGSGGLGIEALSRGIDKVTFIDNNYLSIKTIKENIDNLKIEDYSKVIKSDAFKILPVLANNGDKFDLVFLDPPYKGQKINEIITFIEDHEILNEDGIIVAECNKEDELIEDYKELLMTKSVIYGITKITIYKKRGS